MKLAKIIISILILPIFMTGCTNSIKYSYNDATKEYETILKELPSANASSAKEVYSLYANLFRHISEGTVSEQTAFANLVREITKNAVEFDDADVFKLAADYAEVFSQLAIGSVETGIQDMSINETNTSCICIEISYVGDIRYSVKTLAPGDVWYLDGNTMQYSSELGQHLLEISFYDTLPSSSFLEKFPNETIARFAMLLGASNCNLIYKGLYTADHGYRVYIGSDVPFFTETVEETKLNKPLGSISIIIEQSKDET